MRHLFDIDTKDYDINGSKYIRPSVRSIIIRDGFVAMVYSVKYDYYKFPGGGIEPGETIEEALIRETAEEAGLNVIPGSIREYGYVHRAEKGKIEDVLIQDNYYYFCDAGNDLVSCDLDDYEREEGFTLEYVRPETAILVNTGYPHGPKDMNMINRETGVLRCLIDDGYFGTKEADRDWTELTGEEKKLRLYLKQKATLDIFLSNHAITQAQYDKSLGDLTVKMGYGDM